MFKIVNTIIISILWLLIKIQRVLSLTIAIHKDFISQRHRFQLMITLVAMLLNY